MTDNWYLYVDKETMTVCRVSPVLDGADDFHVIRINQELGISFIDQPHTINDYVVYHDGATTHFVKKDKTNEVLVPFYYSPVMIKEGTENPDVLLTIDNEQLVVTIKPELIQYAMTLFANIDDAQTLFYVSEKNDPNKLITVLSVDMKRLISTGEEKFGFVHNPRLVSIFTRKVFDSYGLKIIP